MILYFADRKMNILGQASTSLPKGVIISNDRKTEEVDEGVAILEFDLEYDPEWRKKAEAWTEAGNYILRKDGDDREFYTIISREKDPVNGSVNDIYAEDAGLDLLNEVVGAYKADKAYSAEFYIKKFSYDSGFEVGVNEVSNLTRKLSWDGEATATERLLSVATQFDNAEISFSFDVDRMSVVHKYINIFKRRGVNSGVQLQIGREIKKIRIKDTIEDLATAYVCTGGIPDGKDDPITLAGYKYDDGDFYVEGTHLNSRKALQKWSRYQIKTETGDNVGHIVKTFSYDTTSQSELCNRAVSSLKKICDVNTTYEVELSYLPQGTKIGDTVYIIDHTGELYLSSRLLKIETSVCNNTKTAELGEYSVKSSGVSEELRELADAFAKVAQNRKFYSWIAYADDDIGTGASLDSYGKEYLGIASNRVTRDPDLTDPTVYTWVRIRGEQGIPGTSGKDGKTSYFHVKYSDVEKPASYSDMTETPSKYIGTYVDYELEDSKDPSKYTWSKFQGEDGADGVAGKNGENGETSYVHFAYATSEDGKANFSTTDPTDKTYIGQYVDFKKADSEQPEKYRWSKFQGPKGPAGSDGEQGYGIVASVTRENFTEDQWNSTYGMTGHLASWTGTSALRNGCRIGDIFVVVGTATDTKNAHTAYYRSDTDAGDLQGICIGHTIAFRGSAGIDGTDGKGIESIKEHYAVSTSNTVTPTVWFDDVLVTNSVNKYLWSYETIIYTDGTSVDSKKRVIGVYGDTGKDGARGVGVSSVDVMYYKSTSATSLSGGSWVTTDPGWENGKYIWSKTVITYTDKTTDESTPVCITGAKGSTGGTGAKGETGAAGKGVTSIIEQYYQSTSATALSGGGWSEKYPGWVNGKYIWTRSVITYTDKTSTTTTAVCVTGTKGSTGNDGKTSYVHMAYANITYVCEENNSFTLTSTTVCRYGKNDKWIYKTLEAGTYTGNTTLFGSDPANGVVKEVNKITGFSITDSSGRAYMGQYTDFEQAGSDDISKYFWAKVQGAKGETGNKGETGASGKNALQPKRNWSGTFTTIGATAIAATTDFNRTPVVGDVFINLDGSSNTGTWQVTALSGTSVTIKLLSYVNSKGATGDKGAPGKDANQVVHSVAGNGNTNKYIEFATVKVIANYANYATTFKISGREYETTDVQFSFVSANNTDPKLYFLRATGEFNVWMYKKTTSTWGLVTKLNEAWGYMRVYNFQPGNDCISLTWTDTRHASLPSGCIAADQLQAAKTATNFMEFNSGTGLQIGDKTNGSWKGFRSRITSTAFEILNEAGTAVASYGRKLIQLGKDSVDAVIELCGGKGSIKHENVGVYGETKSTLTVNGVNLGLLADDSVIIRSEQVDGDNTTYTSQIYMTKGRIDIATFTELEDGTVTSSNGVDIDDNVGIDIGVPGETETALSKARINGRSLLDFLHPVGSIYMSTSATNPTNLFGGTWVAWGAGRVPVGFSGGDGNFNSSEKTGGSKTINIQHNHGLSNARAAVGRADSSASTISYTAGGNPHNVYFDREFSYWGGIAGVSKHATDTAKIYGNTDNGGSTAASVLQPYITCYMWKRTA